MRNPFSRIQLSRLPKKSINDQRGVRVVVFAITLAVLTPMRWGMVDVYPSASHRGKLQDLRDMAAL